MGKKGPPKGVSNSPATQFKPGDRAAARLPPGFKPLKNLTRKELNDVANVLIKGDMEGLRRIANDPASPALLATLASVVVRMHAQGDMDALDKLLNRIIGKVRDEVLHGGSIGGNHGSAVIVTLPSNGREVKRPGEDAQ